MKSGAVVVLLAALVGCGGHGATQKTDAGGDASSDGGVCLNSGRRAAGMACACNADCATGFCVDGVCCSSACQDNCKTCNVPGSVGTCSFVPSGIQPPDRTRCIATDVSTCGLDGTCDGAGACRMVPEGVVCKPGLCTGAALDDVDVCDGQGRCRPGPATICAPFNCDPTKNACTSTCTRNADCVSGVNCVRGSCGPKPPGAVCTTGSDCASGFCSDGVCCNVACRGACVSCNEAGRLGTCWPSDAGHQDPHHICTDQGAASCGRTGVCDGLGGCARYPAETICVPSACNGDRLNTAGSCDGLGACRAPGLQTCDPYRCVSGACVIHCETDLDCIAGHACQYGSCGKKTDGQTCSVSSDCASTFCVDGVCCGDACPGACRSCALPSALGVCKPVPAGADDPHSICTNQGAASCGTDQKCDGAGACRRYKAGTVCAPERCQNNVYTPAATCNATGNCVAPDALACPPFACNGSKCYAGCTVDGNCAPGNVCVANSCGKKSIGAACADRSECASGTCAQGVCCATACTSSCKSCALPGMRGQCLDVPKDGSDPTETCLEQARQTCGTTGKCEAGACQKYAPGTPCMDASCPAPSIILTPGSTCDGAGICVTPAPVSCFPFGCGVAACKSACSADADCAPPAMCNAGSCGLKPPGAVCGGGSECLSSICAQGVCCTTECKQSCRSCAVAGKAGICSPVPGHGTDPAGVCTDRGAGSCGTTGFCDGAGGCQLYPVGTLCAGPSCALGASLATLARTCDGTGSCQPATTQSCGSYLCNGTTCNAACGGDADCVPGNVCNGGACGLKRLGQTCGAAAECQSGNCVDSVCCSAAACGTCLSCNVPGQAGTCQTVPAGTSEPHGGCTPSPPCGRTGKCDGLGACQNAPVSTSCGSASCSGSTFTPAGACDGAGSCKSPTSSCAPYLCGASACLTTCATDSDCAPGNTCQSGSCTNHRPNGGTCLTGADCTSTHCTDGVCCASASCGSCNSCAVSGKQGMCAPVPPGPDPAGVCAAMSAASCGTTGACDGAGQCAVYPSGTICLAACPAGTSGGTTSVCNGSGQCVASATDCLPYTCDSVAGVCKASCMAPGDCAPGYTCSASGDASGTCQP